MFSVFLLLIFTLISAPILAQSDTLPKPPTPVSKDIPPLKFKLNEDGSHFFQAAFTNQIWFRFNESNPGTMVENRLEKQTVDIGLRRTRIQMFGQVTDRVFLYFQFGMNNFNSQSGIGGNRKLAAFFHDALCEYEVGKNNKLHLGGGLTITNGLSRFSQPSIGTIMTLDVPVFAQATVDATDLFSRKLSIYARGQLGKLDYRLSLSDPFPITSSGQTISFSKQANYSPIGHFKQYQGYFQYQFLDKESITTPYMTGTYLGKKRVLTIGGGIIFQKKAMWKQGESPSDTIYQDLLLMATECYYDSPLNKEKETALSAYVGFFHCNYGSNYLRFNGQMNPASSISNPAGFVSGSGSVYGNALPMFGTGNVLYGQIGYLLPKNWLHLNGALMPYCAWTHAEFDRLNGENVDICHAGINWLINGHKAKITLDWQNRPIFNQNEDGKVHSAGRRNQVVLQYQISI